MARLAVVPFAIVFGAVIGHAARWFTDGLTVNAQLYFHAFRISYVHSPWVWAPLKFLSAAVLQYSAIASWAFVGGYACRRWSQQRLAAGMLVASAVLGSAVTTTSVRIAQARFFESSWSSSVQPAAVTVLFVVVPAYLGALAVRRASITPAAIALLSFMAIGLAWWNASELGDALTFGCVLQTASGVGYCTAREFPWGFIIAAALTAIGALTALDALGGDGLKPHSGVSRANCGD